MKKEGAIILGIGGDNSHGAQGTFYEGAMTSGYPSDATENAVQANIVAANYAVTSVAGRDGHAMGIFGASISLQATSEGCTTQYLAHTGSTINTQEVSNSLFVICRADLSTSQLSFGSSSRSSENTLLIHFRFRHLVTPLSSNKPAGRCVPA